MTGQGEKLGPFLAMMLVAGGMIGTGIYLLPASLAAFGSVSILGWLLAIAGAVVLAGVFSALAVLRPGDGGPFCDIRDALGPGAGFVIGALYWLPPNNVPVALAVTGYLSVFAPEVAHGAGATWTTLIVVWLLIGANIVGPRFVSRLSGGTLIIGLAPILLVAVGGWAWFRPEVFAASWNVTGHGLWQVVPASAVLAFWAFLSLENAAIVAPMIRDPARNVPLATFGGVAIAAAVYLAASSVIMGIMPASELARSSAPFADAARPWLGALVAGAIALCAMLKACGTLGVNDLVLAETGNSDAVLGQIVRRRPPRAADRLSVLSLVVFGAVMSAAVVVSASPSLARQFTVLTNIVVVITMLFYAAACLALLRFSGAARPVWRGPIRALACVGVVFCCGMIAASERDLLVWSAAAVGLAAAVYLCVAARRRWGRDEALESV